VTLILQILVPQFELDCIFSEIVCYTVNFTGHKNIYFMVLTAFL